MRRRGRVTRGVGRVGTTGVRSLVLLASSIVSGPASAETLVLNDGTVIRGDIKTLQDDVYVVETDALGTLRVRKQDIRTIDLGDGSAPGRTARSTSNESLPGQAELQAIQSRMLQDPDLFSMIEALRSDPDMQAVLSDPEIMRALATGDLLSLMNHPKIIALTGNAKVREVIEGVR